LRRPRLLLGIPADAIAVCGDGAVVVHDNAVGVGTVTIPGMDVADIDFSDCS
jgi:hypothetical protein